MCQKTDLSNCGVVTLPSSRGAFGLQICMSNLQALHCLDLFRMLFAAVVPSLPVCAGMRERVPPDEGGSAHMPVSTVQEAA